MHYCHQVLYHFLLRRKPFLVEHQNLTAMLFRVTLEPLETEPCQTVTVSDYQCLDLSHPDIIHDRLKLLAFKIQSSAYFLDKLNISQSAGRAEILQHMTLILQVRLLRECL